MICLETLKPQLDRTEPSYVAALARCQRAADGAATHPDGIIRPFGTLAVVSERAPILPDPPGAQRRAPGARGGRRRMPSPMRDRALALLRELGHPATAEDLAPGDRQMMQALKDAKVDGLVLTRSVVLDGEHRRRNLYALPGMAWPDQPAGARYVAQLPRSPGAPLSKTQSQLRHRRHENT